VRQNFINPSCADFLNLNARFFFRTYALLSKFRREEPVQNINKTAPFSQAENYPTE